MLESKIMKLSFKPVPPSYLPFVPSTQSKQARKFRCVTTQLLKHIHKKSTTNSFHLLDPLQYQDSNNSVSLGKRWREYQGVEDWDGLLDPLDDILRGEILRYGAFVEAAYKSFDFNPSSPTYGTCRFCKNTLLHHCDLTETGYRLTKNLHATSGIDLPCWTKNTPNGMSIQSSWIGYVAVCQDKDEISRLGRRDVVIALRGTATCLEWAENLRATLTHLPNDDSVPDLNGSKAMVESGFLSLYTSGTDRVPSLQQTIREEIKRLLQSYGDEPLSLTITGHSLGAALATLAAYDIKTYFNRAPLVTVYSFGGPRVGNRRFQQKLDKQGTKVLRIVNTNDVITKIPGFVIDENHMSNNTVIHVSRLLPSWIQKSVEGTQWVYAEVGKELKLSSKDSPYVNSDNMTACHDLKTYLHLISGFVSTACPFKESAKSDLHKYHRQTQVREKENLKFVKKQN